MPIGLAYYCDCHNKSTVIESEERVVHPLKVQNILIQAIREFFLERDFVEITVPPVVTNPGMETHIHPFQLYSAKNQTALSTYLHTSPEFYMKRVLSEGIEKIFTIGHSFREEPQSPIHRQQFIMLEWYRANSNYLQIMQELEDLFHSCYNKLQLSQLPLDSTLENRTFQRMTIQELFKEIVDLDILQLLETEQLRKVIQSRFPQIPSPKTGGWDDYFFLLFLNCIEPKLKEYPLLLLYEYPHHLSALSTIKKNDPRVCERFELYVNGIEICNAFNELTEIEEQKRRFIQDLKDKKSLYDYTLSEPEVLYQALENGIPPSGGIALGVERLLATLTNNCFGFYD